MVDDLFIYVTGGLAGGHFKTTYQSAINVPGVININNVAEFSDWRLGWVAGVGTEWKWTDHWTVKGEVLYAEFADRTNTVLFGAAPGTPASFTESDSIWISRIALNYKF